MSKPNDTTPDVGDVDGDVIAVDIAVEEPQIDVTDEVDVTDELDGR